MMRLSGREAQKKHTLTNTNPHLHPHAHLNWTTAPHGTLYVTRARLFVGCFHRRLSLRLHLDLVVRRQQRAGRRVLRDALALVLPQQVGGGLAVQRGGDDERRALELLDRV